MDESEDWPSFWSGEGRFGGVEVEVEVEIQFEVEVTTAPPLCHYSDMMQNQI